MTDLQALILLLTLIAGAIYGMYRMGQEEAERMEEERLASEADEWDRLSMIRSNRGRR